jgi:hypothetical protein
VLSRPKEKGHKYKRETIGRGPLEGGRGKTEGVGGITKYITSRY